MASEAAEGTVAQSMTLACRATPVPVLQNNKAQANVPHVAITIRRSNRAVHVS